MDERKKRMLFLEFLLCCLYCKKHSYGISWYSSNYFIVKFYNMNNRKYYDPRIEELYRECDNIFPERYNSSTASDSKIRFRNKLNKLVTAGYLGKEEEKSKGSIREVKYKILRIPDEMKKKYLFKYGKYDNIRASLNGREDVEKISNDVLDENKIHAGLCTLGSGSLSTEQSSVPIGLYGIGGEDILEKNSQNFDINIGPATLPVQEFKFLSDITMEDQALLNSFEEDLRIDQIDIENILLVSNNTLEKSLDIDSFFDSADSSDLENPEVSYNINELLEYISTKPM